MVDIAILLGADKTKATEELKESLQFEMKLANVSRLFTFTVSVGIDLNWPLVTTTALWATEIRIFTSSVDFDVK